MEEITLNDSGEKPPIIKPMKPDPGQIKVDFTGRTVLVMVLVVFLGLTSGYLLYAKQTEGTVRLAGKDVEVVKTETEEGVKDASTFRDTATGILKENDGKITDEGTHILGRGDPSQNVYLTSSVIDMSGYVGKKVQVWGETYKGRRAGWLMDVGRIKIVN